MPISWRHEHGAGREEGAKDRPCVVVLAVERPTDGATLVRVVPVTHRPPNHPAVALELPQSVERHLGLDDERSWVMLDEVNDFAWPGFDLRPVPRDPGSFAYGFLPPRLFDDLLAKLRKVWSLSKGSTRDEIEPAATPRPHAASTYTVPAASISSLRRARRASASSSAPQWRI